MGTVQSPLISMTRSVCECALNSYLLYSYRVWTRGGETMDFIVKNGQSEAVIEVARSEKEHLSSYANGMKAEDDEK